MREPTLTRYSPTCEQPGGCRVIGEYIVDDGRGDVFRYCMNHSAERFKQYRQEHVDYLRNRVADHPSSART